MKSTQFDDWFHIVYFIGLGLSFISCSLVLTILFRINFKDNSTKLRIYLSLIDLCSTIFLAIPYIPNGGSPIYQCFYNALYYFIIMLHGFWVLFISFFLYMLICKRNDNVTKFTTPAIITFTIISLLATVVVLIIPGDGIQCVVLNKKNNMIIYLLITSVAFEVTIFTIITLFYIQIRKVIKKELSSEDKLSKRNRVYCLRLLSYPIMFFVLLAFTELNVFQYVYSDSDGLLLFEIRILVVGYYPCFNSMLYGYTKSSRKFLWSLLLKVPEYSENQELINDIRTVGFIKDRIFMDLADMSESDIFD